MELSLIRKTMRFSLRTDHLRKLYGPIHPQILLHNRFERKRFVRMLDDQGKCRMAAYTELNVSAWDDAIRAIDEEIEKGGFIGETFKKYGYVGHPYFTQAYNWPIPSPEVQKMLNTQSPFAHIWRYEYFVWKFGVKPIVYGTVYEIFHPDYMKPGLEKGIVWTSRAYARELERQNRAKEQEVDREMADLLLVFNRCAA